MDEEIKNKFKEYEELKIKAKSIEERLNDLKPLLVDSIPEDTSIEASFGKFSLKRRTEWKYTDNTLRMQTELKEIQKVEQQTGEAEATLGEPYIQYTVKK